MFYKPSFCAMFSVFLLLSGKAFTQEQWQIDQAAGKYWYVEDDYLYTYDPKENNPGTMFVIPQEDGRLKILISPDLEYADYTEVPVRYAFNESLENANSTLKNWSTVQISEGVFVLNAPVEFVNQFSTYSQKSGYVEIEIIDKYNEAAHRTFILNGYLEAASEVVESTVDNEDSLETPNENREWYIGGTLNGATGSAWQQSSYDNRLATAADFSAKVLEGKVSSMDQLRPYATELASCITSATAGPESRNTRVTEIAAACIIMLKWN